MSEDRTGEDTLRPSEGSQQSAQPPSEIVHHYHLSGTGLPGETSAERAAAAARSAFSSTPQGGTLRENYLYEQSVIARKSATIAFVLGILFPPLAYVYVREVTMGVVNLITFNFLLFGYFWVWWAVPLKIFLARDELRKAGLTSAGTPRRSGWTGRYAADADQGAGGDRTAADQRDEG